MASTLAGGRRVRRVLDEAEDLPLLQDAVSSIRTYPELEQAIGHCIDDRGEVTERASEKLSEFARQDAHYSQSRAGQAAEYSVG